MPNNKKTENDTIDGKCLMMQIPVAKKKRETKIEGDAVSCVPFKGSSNNRGPFRGDPFVFPVPLSLVGFATKVNPLAINRYNPTSLKSCLVNYTKAFGPLFLRYAVFDDFVKKTHFRFGIC